jgi:hypothetical protein
MPPRYLIGIDPGVQHFAVAVCDTTTNHIIHLACVDISRDEDNVDESEKNVDWDKLHFALQIALNACHLVIDLVDDDDHDHDHRNLHHHGAAVGAGLGPKRADVKALIENQFASTVHQFRVIEVVGACFLFMCQARVPASGANSSSKFSTFGVAVPKKGHKTTRKEYKLAAQTFMDQWFMIHTQPTDRLRTVYWGATDKPMPSSQHQRHDLADAMMMVLAASHLQKRDNPVAGGASRG